jgi:hypothetical protein
MLSKECLLSLNHFVLTGSQSAFPSRFFQKGDEYHPLIVEKKIFIHRFFDFRIIAHFFNQAHKIKRMNTG